ncbi:unnamed protein product [Trichobilharzia szidati]|nr:unnamed protein product [Trichobilharzia szidati]
MLRKLHTVMKLKELVKESQLANSYRQSIKAAIKNGESLGDNVTKVHKNLKKAGQENKAKKLSRLPRPQKRSKSLIELSGAYEPERYRPPPELVKESQLANSYRQSIKAAIKNGESLGDNVTKVHKNLKKAGQENKAKKLSRLPRPQKRSKSLIELSGAYEPERYRPPPVGLNTGPSEKLRLAHLMTYGEEPTVKSLKNDQIKDGRLEYLSRRILKYPKVTGDDDDDGHDNQSENCKDRFEELMDEVNERREFLAQMENLGRVKEYRATIETEISQLIREMEEIDLKRTKQMYAKDNKAK